jgi:hypothetical protein
MTTIITGKGIDVWSLLNQRAACKLEALSLRHSSRSSVLAYSRKRFDLKRNAPVEEVLAAYDKAIEEAKALCDPSDFRRGA